MLLNYARKNDWMTDGRQQDGFPVLAHWTYSITEWKNFKRWESRKKGFLHYVLHLFSSSRPASAPFVIFTYHEISTHAAQQALYTPVRRLTNSQIYDAGKMNVMEIRVEQVDGKQVIPKTIRVPVPRGKLREAIQLQENLLAHYRRLA